MSQCREMLSKGNPESLFQAEIHMLSKEQRQTLLEEAGITVHILPDQGLAMKADLALPWNKLREIRRLTRKHELLSYIYVYTNNVHVYT